MPKRTDLKKILIIGSGPIVIGQAAEFDYAGTQACLALKEEDYEVVLVNSNPATIMTDTTIADKVYMEPLTLEYVAKILRYERPDAIVPGIGGQTGLNLAMQLEKKGILKECQVELLGTPIDSIERAEDRELFKEMCQSIGEPVIPSQITYSVEEAIAAANEIGYPVVLRPAFTLGGTGGGFANNEAELVEIMKHALKLSPVHQVLVEKSVKGYKEIEFEVMRDGTDHAITICGMENIDPVGVHTGDSIVVAPILTLNDHDFTMLRDSALKIIKELKIEGGCNVQFALNPNSSEYYLIEVNPRVSRSSALASKASGYPIARVTAKIAVGMTLDEIKLGETTANYEPALDYIVAKMPRFPFDKFATAANTLSTQMKATGEVMAIGRNFEQALMKAVRGAEISQNSLNMKKLAPMSVEELREKILAQDDERLFAIYESFKRGVTVAEIHELTKIDEWFLNKLMHILSLECRMQSETLSDALYMEAKQNGFPDAVIKEMTGLSEIKHVPACYRMVDTCSAEFTASTPYFYSTFGEEDEAEEFIKENASGKPVVMVFGSGPIRIGQGIEFDFASVHCVWSLKRAGYEVVIVNNNPETVSTDFDTADRLYFEPLTPEDVTGVVEAEKPDYAIVQFGGQTAINLAAHLEKLGVPILGTPAWSIDAAEDREKFDVILEKCGIPRPAGHTVMTEEEAVKAADELGYPVLVRPSYVLGGQGMEIAYKEADVREFMQVITRNKVENPVLVDKYMMGREIEVDAICDGDDILIPGIMEHFERAGVHSGDSISIYPSINIEQKHKDTLVKYTEALAKNLAVLGLVNIQFVLYNDQIYVIEVNPRSSRTVPYISKVTGVPMVDLATRCMFGEKLKDMGCGTGLHPESDHYAVKVPVFSFQKLRDLDTQLGPEMKSTGEVLGVAKTFREALLKGLTGAGFQMKKKGAVLISVRDSDKQEAIRIGERFEALGFDIYATSGTANVLNRHMVATNSIRNVDEPSPNIIDLIESGKIDYVVATSVKGRHPELGSVHIRRTAVERAIPCLTSMDTVSALLRCLEGDIKIENCEMVDINTI